MQKTTIARLPLLGVFSLLCFSAMASTPQHKWVATWSQSMTSNYHELKDSSGAVKKDANGRALVSAPSLHDATLRQVVLTSIGGDRARIRLSNYYGQKPLSISSAFLAQGASGTDERSAIVPGSSTALTFGGKRSITLAPGQVLRSDAVSIHVQALSSLTVSLYMAGSVELGDVHPAQHQRKAFAVQGDQAQAASLAGTAAAAVEGEGKSEDIQKHLYLLDAVDVEVPATTRGIVAFGDSITDGSYSTGPSKSWPGALAGIANGTRGGTPAGVVNSGIGANELTTDQIGSPGAGASGLKRFQRDVIDQAGVTDVLVLFGANDLNRGIGPAGYPDGASAGDLIASFKMLIDVAHQHHLRIYGATITPFAGFPAPGWYSPRKEAIRRQVNHWIRDSGAFDGVVDFSAAVSGRYKPAPLAAAQATLPPGMANVCAGDAGLHPNDRGYAVMGTFAYNALFQAALKPEQACH